MGNKSDGFTMDKGPISNLDYKAYGNTAIESLEESGLLDDEDFYGTLDTGVYEEIIALKETIDYFTISYRVNYFDPEIRAELISKKEEIKEVLDNLNII